MRTHQLLLAARYVVALALLGSTWACSLDTVDPPPPMPFDETSHVTANVDDRTFTANYYVQSWIGEILNDQVAVAGLEVDPTYSGRQVTVIIHGFTGPGTYSIGAESDTSTWAFFIDSPDMTAPMGVREQQDSFFATQHPESGTITVDSYDPASMKMVGTFSFTAVLDGTLPEELVTVTNGSFSGFIHPVR